MGRDRSVVREEPEEPLHGLRRGVLRSLHLGVGRVQILAGLRKFLAVRSVQLAQKSCDAELLHAAQGILASKVMLQELQAHQHVGSTLAQGYPLTRTVFGGRLPSSRSSANPSPPGGPSQRGQCAWQCGPHGCMAVKCSTLHKRMKHHSHP